MAPTLNRDFSGYRIVRPLELSPGASIWEAQGVESGRSVAIETLAGDAATDPELREWFGEVWEAIASLSHPHLVAVEELGTEGGVPFAVRLPASPTTLAKRLGVRGSLEPELAGVLIVQIGEALEAAHEAGAVHGSLDPARVLIVERDGVHSAILAGFGRAEGDRREDVRELGSILAAMLGKRPVADTGGEDRPAEPDERLATLEAVVATARDGGFESAAQLVAAVREGTGDEAAERSPDDSAEGTGEPAEVGGPAEIAGGPVAGSRAAVAGGPSGDPEAPRSGRGAKVAVALLAIAAIVAAILLLGDDDGSGDPSGGTDVGSERPTEPSSTPTTPETTSPVPAPGARVPEPITVRGFPVGVSAREGIVYVVTREGGRLSGFDQGTGKRRLRPVDLGGAAEDVTIVDGVAWATLPDSGAVARVDLGAARSSAERIDVGKDPTSLVGGDGSIWVTDSGSDALSQIPLDGGKAKSVPLDGSEPSGIAFGQGALWVSAAGGKLLRIDPSSPADQRTFDVGSDPRGVLVAGNRVYVAEAGDGAVAEVNPRNGRIQRIDVGGSPRELGADPRNLWVANADGYVTSVDLDSRATQQIDLSGAGGSPRGITVDEQVWTATGSGDSLVAVAPGR